jgi:ribosomal protein S18 acetylase RimI-like enzyme
MWDVRNSEQFRAFRRRFFIVRCTIFLSSSFPQKGAAMQRIYPASPAQKPLWIELLITALGIAGFVFGLLWYDRAFPSASLDLKYSRDEIETRAMDQLRALGYDPSGYEFVLTFSSTNLPAYYLQQTLGVEEANRLIVDQKLPLNYWSVRWFKPSQQEEFSMDFSTDGEMIGFDHTIAEADAGESLEQDQARAIAETFLASTNLWNDNDWSLEDSSTKARPNRLDHTFGWRKVSFKAGESELRLSVTVQGDKPGSLSYFVKTPEAYQRYRTSQSNRAGFINNAAYFLGVGGFSLVAIIALALSFPSWKAALPASLLVAAVTLLSYLNSMPLFSMGYSTTSDYSLFWINNGFAILVSVFFAGISIFVYWAGAQSLSRWIDPMRDRILPRGGDRWITLSKSAWRGIMVGGILLAYTVLFYITATKVLGGWVPSYPDINGAYATRFPFIDALLIGISAGIEEELLFRLLGIAFITWLTRNKWLGVLIPAVLWAFAHTSYVRDPIYMRGIELTIDAILIFSFFYLKFDLMTTIMAHLTYNSFMGGLPLLRSEDIWFQINGWIVILCILLPVLPGLITMIRNRSRASASPTLTLDPAAADDQAALIALPVKADWSLLINDPNRLTLCLKRGSEMIGFVTASLVSLSTDEAKVGVIDGLYVVPSWRRQYWGIRLLDAIKEDLKTKGAQKFRVAIAPNDKPAHAFFRNNFWKTDVHVLSDGEAPKVGDVFKRVLGLFRRERKAESALEIPRSLL